MRKYKLIIIGLVILAGCSAPSKTNQDQFPNNNIRFAFNNPTILTSRFHSEFKLDSIAKVMWTDKIMPNEFYSASYLATFNKFYDFEVFAVETEADDWTKSFLMTLNNKKEIIDYIEITDNYGDADQDSMGNETVIGYEKSTRFINDSVFIRITIDETIFYYQQPTQFSQKDSIIEMFGINRNGKFMKLKKDSIRVK